MDGTSGGGWSVVERVGPVSGVSKRMHRWRRDAYRAKSSWVWRCRCALSSPERPSSRSQETRRAPGVLIHFAGVYIPPVCQRHLSLLAVNSQIHKFTNPQSTSHSTTIHNERSSPAADPAQVLFSLAQCSAHTLAEGKGLKKTQVNDRSAPQVAGKAGGAGASSSSSTAASAGGASSNATSRPPAPPMPSGNDPASQLAGLFAGGMPTLRKTGDRAACQYESLLAMIIILLQ